MIGDRLIGTHITLSSRHASNVEFHHPKSLSKSDRIDDPGKPEISLAKTSGIFQT
ncbi:MAG: hypothetical protein ACYDB1_05875 [Acidiferrobacteraceae bacterium]